MYQLLQHHSHYIAFAGWNVQDVINIYNDVQLDASPKSKNFCSYSLCFYKNYGHLVKRRQCTFTMIHEIHRRFFHQINNQIMIALSS